MKLVTVVELAKHIGFDPGVATDKLDAATEAATQTLIGLLNTELDRVAVVDDFYVLSTGSLPIGNTYRTRLALSRGFISSPVSISFGATLDDLVGSPVSLASTIMNIDHDRGGVVITGPNLKDTFVRASYVAGFDVDYVDAGLFTGLPEWMKEVALMAAVSALDTTHPDLRFDKGSGAKDSANALNAAVVGRLGSKIRYFPSSTWPVG